VRRVFASALALVLLGTATQLADAGAPPRRAVAGERAAQAAVPAPLGTARDPAARIRPEASALAAAWRAAAFARTRGRTAASPEAPPPRRIGATRLALLEKRGLIRRAGAPLRIAGVDHTRFEVTKHGLPFLDRGGRIHERDGRPLGVSGRTQLPPLALQPKTLDRAHAIARAKAAAGVETLWAPPRVRLGWAPRADKSVLAFEVTLASRLPLGDHRVWIDAADGAVLGSVDRLVTFEQGTGVVYAENPLDSKSPTDQPLRELEGSGRLSGRLVAVFDDSATEAFRPDLRFEFPTTEPRFVQTSVYRGLTDTGLLAEQHGFVVGDAVPTFTGLSDAFTGGPLNNAFYSPSIPLFGFGSGDGTVLRNLGTDIDVAAHEYGHHVFERLVTPLVFSADDPVLAMTEGVADTFSLLIGGDERIGNSVVPGAKALRILSSTARFPEAFSSDPHATGLVYGGVSLDLVKDLGAGPFTDLLIASLPFLPQDPVETDYRDAFIDGDAAQNAGANEDLLRDVFQRRGFSALDPPPQFEGELVEGMPETRTLSGDDYDAWIFSELPPAAQVRFQTSGTGNVDVVVLPIGFDAATPGTVSAGPTSSESATVGPFSPVSIDAADAWWVFVLDAPSGGGSTYTLQATVTPRADDIALGSTVAGSIVNPDEEIDWYQFSGVAGQHVRVAASATGGLIDPFVAVLTADPFEVLDTDDDSGVGVFGLDALLQGVTLPATGKYVVAVLSVASDFDPLVGAGTYSLSVSACSNTGPDTDGDGSADVCDQDDDDDTFVDAEDLAPLDASVCIDVDDDGCNDCASGSFDFANDGPDADGDTTCNLGDDDDDNDGCLDAVDPAPLVPSADDDLDFLGADCDNCAVVPNPAQEDAADDGAGDACSVCARVDWQQPPSTPPDQNPAANALQLSVKGLGASLHASGAFNPAGGGAIDPSTSGVQLRVADAKGALLDVAVPGALGGAPCGSGDGWTQKGTSFSYANRSGALPPLCVSGSAQGLSSLRLDDDRAGASGAVLYDLRGKNVTLAHGLASPVQFFQIDLALGQPPAPGVPSTAGAAGVCAEGILRTGVGGTACRIAQKDGAIRSVRCQAE
jgi:hypothetical protein